MRSPGSNRSPRGMIIASPRMIADDPESAGIGALPQRSPDDRAGSALGHVELDHLDPAAGEDVGLHRRRHADGARDGLGDLDLRRDHEVDVELPLAPGLEVLGARRADHRRRPRRSERANVRRRC